MSSAISVVDSLHAKPRSKFLNQRINPTLLKISLSYYLILLRILITFGARTHARTPYTKLEEIYINSTTKILKYDTEPDERFTTDKLILCG